MSRIIKAVRDARGQGSEAPRLCLVGNGDHLGRVAGVLSAGAADERGGVSAAVDVLSPADFPSDVRLSRSIEKNVSWF